MARIQALRHLEPRGSSAVGGPYGDDCSPQQPALRFPVTLLPCSDSGDGDGDGVLGLGSAEPEGVNLHFVGVDGRSGCIRGQVKAEPASASSPASCSSHGAVPAGKSGFQCTGCGCCCGSSSEEHCLSTLAHELWAAAAPRHSSQGCLTLGTEQERAFALAPPAAALRTASAGAPSLLPVAAAFAAISAPRSSPPRPPELPPDAGLPSVSAWRPAKGGRRCSDVLQSPTPTPAGPTRPGWALWASSPADADAAAAAAAG